MDREQFDYTQVGKDSARGRPLDGGIQPGGPAGGRAAGKPVLVGLVGCAGTLIFGLLLVGGIVAFVWGIMAMMKGSDAYQEAVARAQQHPVAREALGEPVEPGWYLTGSVNSGQGTGQAKLEIPLSGPRDSGTLYVESRTEGGELRFRILTLRVRSSGEHLNLLRD